MDDTFFVTVNLFDNDDNLIGFISVDENIDGSNTVELSVTDSVEQSTTSAVLDLKAVKLLIEQLEVTKAFLEEHENRGNARIA